MLSPHTLPLDLPLVRGVSHSPILAFSSPSSPHLPAVGCVSVCHSTTLSLCFVVCGLSPRFVYRLFFRVEVSVVSVTVSAGVIHAVAESWDALRPRAWQLVFLSYSVNTVPFDLCCPVLVNSESQTKC